MGSNPAIALYEVVSRLPRSSFDSIWDQLPENGIYLFFERGETLNVDGVTRDRITRVGGHIKLGRLPRRMQEHYGNKRSLRGNKNASVFRRHLGGAILRRAAPDDPRLETWITQGSPTLIDVEELVSQELRSNFTFVCIPIDSYEDRRFFVSGLIALLAQHPLQAPSANWLGHFAAATQIRESGLWNIDHIDGEPLGLSDIQRLETFTR